MRYTLLTFVIVNGSIMVTGSRDIDREMARALFEQHLSPFLSQGRTWLAGTSRGVDEWALEWLLENSETCWTVVPYTRFKVSQRIQPLLEQVDRIVELQLPKRKTANAIRNRHMVDLAQIVFGFWSSKGGGTVKTLKYALRQRREVHAIPVAVEAVAGGRGKKQDSSLRSQDSNLNVSASLETNLGYENLNSKLEN